MKKLLLGSTAIIAAATLVAPTVATAEVTVSGHLYQAFGKAVSGSETAAVPAAGTGATATPAIPAIKHASEDMLTSYQDAGLKVSASTDINYGLTVGATIKVATENGDSAGVDEAYATVSSDFGTLIVGAEDPAADLLNTTSGAVTYNSLNGGSWNAYYTPTGAVGIAFMNTGQEFLDDTMGIQYHTPSIAGLQAGASYRTNDKNYGDNQRPATAGKETGAVDSEMSFAGKYSGEFSGIGITLGGGYTMAQIGDPVGAQDKSPGVVRLGGSVSMAGITVAGGYSFAKYKAATQFDQDDNGTTANGTLVKVNNEVDNSTIFASAKYVLGAHTIGGEFINATGTMGGVDDTAADTSGTSRQGETKTMGWLIGYGYDLGGGISVDARFASLSNEATTYSGDGVADAKKESDAMVVEAGLGVTF